VYPGRDVHKLLTSHLKAVTVNQEKVERAKETLKQLIGGEKQGF
jgi:hypothetical protein